MASGIGNRLAHLRGPLPSPRRHMVSIPHLQPTLSCRIPCCGSKQVRCSSPLLQLKQPAAARRGCGGRLVSCGRCSCRRLHRELYSIAPLRWIGRWTYKAKVVSIRQGEREREKETGGGGGETPASLPLALSMRTKHHFKAHHDRTSGPMLALPLGQSWPSMDPSPLDAAAPPISDWRDKWAALCGRPFPVVN